MRSRRRRRHARSPAAGLLDDDDLLCEILLRLPPQPSSLPRASAVCKRWRLLVSGAGFFRRFRLRHRRNPPLLGVFEFDRDEGISFLPTTEAPNCVPPGRFLPSGVGDFHQFLGCRHGLVLIHLLKLIQVLVWDPVTGDQRRIALPAPFDKSVLMNGAVFRAAGDAQHFQVVLAVADGKHQHRRALACVYSSQTGLWGNLLSIPLSYRANGYLSTFIWSRDAVLAGDSLYWVLRGNSDRILQFDLVKQRLDDVIRVPVGTGGNRDNVKIMRAEGGGLGVLFVSSSDCTAQLWKRETDCDGVTSWRLGKTIELDKLLSLKSEEKMPLFLLGYGEENNVVFLKTFIGVFMIHLESLKFKKLLEDTKYGRFPQYHPFESVYAAGTCVGVGHDGAELMLNT